MFRTHYGTAFPTWQIHLLYQIIQSLEVDQLIPREYLVKNRFNHLMQQAHIKLSYDEFKRTIIKNFAARDKDTAGEIIWLPDVNTGSAYRFPGADLLIPKVRLDPYEDQTLLLFLKNTLGKNKFPQTHWGFVQWLWEHPHKPPCIQYFPFSFLEELVLLLVNRHILIVDKHTTYLNPSLVVSSSSHTVANYLRALHPHSLENPEQTIHYEQENTDEKQQWQCVIQFQLHDNLYQVTSSAHLEKKAALDQANNVVLATLTNNIPAVESEQDHATILNTFIRDRGLPPLTYEIVSLNSDYVVTAEVTLDEHHTFTITESAPDKQTAINRVAEKLLRSLHSCELENLSDAHLEEATETVKDIMAPPSYAIHPYVLFPTKKPPSPEINDMQDDEEFQQKIATWKRS